MCLANYLDSCKIRFLDSLSAKISFRNIIIRLRTVI